jgi:SAM-dependent methyltransferase
LSDSSTFSGGAYRVLNVGSGVPTRQKLQEIFCDPDWREVRLDIDPAVKPDLLGDMTDMRHLVASQSFDAVWSSHNLEHLYDYQVPKALSEFCRVLKPHGFVIVNCPDVLSIARQIVERGLENTAYVSNAGPISPLDMLYGYGRAIAAGNTYMAHRTGFTIERLKRLFDVSGFKASWVAAGDGFDLWAVAMMDATDAVNLRRHLEQTGLKFPQ